MEENSNSKTEEELKNWVKNQLQSAVRELTEQGLFNTAMVEAKPAWVFPFGLLIGMIREQGEASSFDWFITGDFPTARVHSSIASTAREAARHFALKWQLEAKRLENSDQAPAAAESSQNADGKTSEQLVEMAQSLYELVEQDSLWQQA
jgi:hypothetical protein